MKDMDINQFKVGDEVLFEMKVAGTAEWWRGIILEEYNEVFGYKIRWGLRDSAINWIYTKPYDLKVKFARVYSELDPYGEEDW